MVEELEYCRLTFECRKLCSLPIISCHLRPLSMAKNVSIYGQLHSIIILSITFSYPFHTMYEIRRVLCVTTRRIFVSKVIIQSDGWEVYIYSKNT